MAPGVHVAHIDATHWSVSTRGFADEFSNKLLVMVDGRSVYTPLFSGVLWSEHGLMLEDIERIEIVRGPGGTLWGANAVNGVIHVITKSAAESQGLMVTSRGGSTERYGASGRYGGGIGDSLHYRVYGKFAQREQFDDAGNGSARDDWQSIRSGGRLDWQIGESDLFTLQGDFYDGEVDRSLVGGIPDEEDNTGANALARLSHTFSPTSSVPLQGWWDRTDREQTAISEERDSFDLELQHGFQPLPRNQITWGAGNRTTKDEIDGSPAISFGSESERDHL
jgi:iron complex outermembrane receptor protein